jgi:multidrug efflux pump
MPEPKRFFTDRFIMQPVLAVVVSVFVLLLGLRAQSSLPVREFPKTVNAFIEVDTTYYGASADTVSGFITTPLENAISRVDGIDYLTGQSQTGQSTVTAFLRLNQDPDRALTEIQAQISSVKDQLPPQSQTPTVHLNTGGQGGTLILSFYSDVMSPEQVTDYLTRVVQPQIQAVRGVQATNIWGAENFALRAWLDPVKMAARGLTAADVSSALAANNFTSGAGSTTGQMVTIPLGITTGVHSAEEFRRLVIRQQNGAIVRLGDVATVELGSDNYQQSIRDNGRNAVLIDVQVVPNGNVLDIVKRVRERFDALQPDLPQGLNSAVVMDVTTSVNASIREVIKTLLESLAIVALVVFAFLRSARASLIPVVTIPLCLIGTFSILWALGFSINLLTLLALVLATGLVVDDAIIVVENVSREIAEGAAPLDAALRSARTLASPIVAMTVVLVAVYVPIAMRTGLTGALFTEFALTLVGSVTVSAVLALTLSPMMCRYLLKPGKHAHEAGTAEPLMQRLYRPALRAALMLRLPLVGFGVLVLAGSFLLYRGATTELAPQEDTGVIIMGGSVAPDSTVDLLKLYDDQVLAAEHTIPEIDDSWNVDVPGQAQGGMELTPWGVRTRSTASILNELQGKLGNIAGESLALFQPPPLPGSFGQLPIGYVIKTTRPFAELDTVSSEFLNRARATGLFAYADKDLKIDLPQSTIVIDRDKVASLGLDMTKIGNVLNTMLSGGYVNYFDMAGRAYKVIPEVERGQRLNPAQLANYTVADINGVPIPLSSVARIETTTVPEQISHFQQMNSATISAVPMPGVSQGDALRALDAIAAHVLPPEYATDTAGPLRQFVHESSGFAATFGLAVVVIYLSLAALFGSFRDPLIILVSVPMSLGGALVFIYLGVHGVTLNIYTEVGLVTLMGLISKHGILMVEVANEQQALGESKRAAIEHAAMLRLRPILMTAAAMVLGVAPLVFATGAGAAARFAMGIVIATGLSIGTLFTLFVVPAFYLVLARRHAARPEPSALPARRPEHDAKRELAAAP